MPDFALLTGSVIGDEPLLVQPIHDFPIETLPNPRTFAQPEIEQRKSRLVCVDIHGAAYATPNPARTRESQSSAYTGSNLYALRKQTSEPAFGISTSIKILSPTGNSEVLARRVYFIMRLLSSVRGAFFSDQGDVTMLTRREFALLGSAGAITLNAEDLLSAGVRTEIPAKRIAVSQPVRVNPELQSAVAELKAQMRTPLNAETLAVARKAWVAPVPLAQPSWYARIIPGHGRAPGVRVYVIGESSGGAPRPAILHIHGGGYVLGTAKDYIPTLQKRSLALDCVCVSVDYRLAPETRFPGSLEDIYAALIWLYRNAETLGVDRSKLAVMGDSAGGGHAAMLAIAVRDRGEIPIVLQSLLYPMLDDRTGSTRKVPSFIGTLLWNAQMNRFGWSALLGEPAGSRRVPYGSVPARLFDLQGLAPAFIGVGSIDLFVDEDIEYARRLINADVPTELHVVPGAFHAFDGIVPNAPISKEFDAAVNRALARAFGSPPTGFSSAHA